MQYHGIPVEKRAAADAKREKAIQEKLTTVERRGFAIPAVLEQEVTAVAQSIVKLAQRYGVQIDPPEMKHIYVMSDMFFSHPSKDKDAYTLGEFHGATKSITLRASEFFPGGAKQDGMFAEKRRAEHLLFQRDFRRMISDPNDSYPYSKMDVYLRGVVAVVLFFSADEISESFFRKDVPVDVLRRLIEERSRTIQGIPREVADLARDSLLPSIVSDQEKMWNLGELALNFSEKETIERLLKEKDVSMSEEAKELIRHEMAHAASHNVISEFSSGHVTRVGYKVPGRRKKTYYLSLNEACTETIAQEASCEDRQNFFETKGTYARDRLLLQHIVRKIAAAKGETTVVVWSRFVRGFFTGELMHLRDIETAFGRKAWDFYTSLTPDDFLGTKKDKTRNTLKKYFGFEYANTD